MVIDTYAGHRLTEFLDSQTTLKTIYDHIFGQVLHILVVTMIAELFVATYRASVLLRKLYRNEALDFNSTEVFSKKIQSITSGHIPPYFVENGVHYYYIRRNSLFFVATCKEEMCAVAAVEFLSRLYHMMKDFCGVVTEESVRANTLLLHEVLCDAMDLGYVQIASTEKLKPYVTSDPVIVERRQTGQEDIAARLFGIENRMAPVTASHKPAVRTSVDEAKKNEIFVDIVERLTAVTDAKGVVSRLEVQGTVNVKNFLLGHPKVKIALNEDLQINTAGQVKGYGSSASFDRCTFHQCVDLTDFDSGRILNVTPPPGEFAAVTYSVNGSGLTLPVRVLIFISDIPNSRDVDVTIRVRCAVPASCNAAYVIVTLPVPSLVSSISQHVVGLSHEVKFKAGEQKVVWSIRKLPGGDESVAQLRLINHTSQSITKADIGPANVDFEVSKHTVSGLQIRYLRVFEHEHSYVPHRWIRYVTVADSFTVKT